MNSKMIKLLALLVFILTGAVGAQAGTINEDQFFTLALKDLNGGSSVVLVDNKAGDLAGTSPGIISYYGTVGSWIIQLSAALSKPAIGNDLIVQLELHSWAINTNPGSILIELSDVNFLPPASNWITSVGGTTTGDVTINTYFNNDNVLFLNGNETPLSTLVLTGDGIGYVKAEDTKTGLQSDPSYSITIAAIINQPTGSYQSTNFDVSLKGSMPVPEPSLLLLIGFGLVGVEIVRRKI